MTFKELQQEASRLQKELDDIVFDRFHIYMSILYPDRSYTASDIVYGSSNIQVTALCQREEIFYYLPTTWMDLQKSEFMSMLQEKKRQNDLFLSKYKARCIIEQLKKELEELQNES